MLNITINVKVNTIQHQNNNAKYHHKCRSKIQYNIKIIMLNITINVEVNTIQQQNNNAKYHHKCKSKYNTTSK